MVCGNQYMQMLLTLPFKVLYSDIMSLNVKILMFFIWEKMYVTLLTEVSKEVCLTEDLNIRCNYNTVIVFTHALYGHLHQGRCIPRDTGLLGCQANIIEYLDDKCSGMRNCVLSTLEPSLRQLEPECAVGLTSFLEVRYSCVSGKCLSLVLD